MAAARPQYVPPDEMLERYLIASEQCQSYSRLDDQPRFDPHSASSPLAIRYDLDMCPLSERKRQDIMFYLDAFMIYTDESALQFYYLPALIYCVNHLANMFVLKDIMNRDRNLAYYIPRIQHLAGLPERIRQLRIQDVDEGFLGSYFKTLIHCWRAREESTIIEQYGILFNFSVWENNNMIHAITANIAEQMLGVKYPEKKVLKTIEEVPLGSFLLRKSSKSRTDGRSLTTVFSISIRMQVDEVAHYRLMFLHRIGLYVIAGTIRETQTIVDDAVMSTESFKTLIAHIRYSKPQYVSIVEFLLDLVKLKFIKLDKLVHPTNYRTITLDELLRVREQIGMPAPAVPDVPDVPAAVPAEPREKKEEIDETFDLM
jgi:hypothetical protein